MENTSSLCLLFKRVLIINILEHTHTRNAYLSSCAQMSLICLTSRNDNWPFNFFSVENNLWSAAVFIAPPYLHIHLNPCRNIMVLISLDIKSFGSVLLCH